MGVRLILLAILALLAPGAAQAMTMKTEGDTIVMSGAVVKADCTEFETLASRPGIRRVVLTNSGGGDASSGYCIGAAIRRLGLSAVIRGRCASSCSRMWLGGVERTLEGQDSRVGLHGNYADSGGLLSDAPQKLRTWIPQYAPGVDRTLMEQWIRLPTNKWMMYFYNGRAELCEGRACSPVDGRTAQNAGLATRAGD